MGTDIHMQVERRRSDGTWEWVREMPPRRCSRCSDRESICGKPLPPGSKDWSGKPVAEGAVCTTWKGHDIERGDDCSACFRCGGSGQDVQPYHGRNYDVFAILADVRNGRGFAGIETGDGFVPILGFGEAALRGLPDDLSPELRYAARHEMGLKGDLQRPACFGPELTEEEEENGEDYERGVPNFGDHSFSWLTLREILDYDWSRSTRHFGVVSVREYKKWRDAGCKGPPESYSGGVSGPGIEHVSIEKMEQLIASGEAESAADEGFPGDGGRYYTRVEWSETYRESAGGDWFRFLDALTPLGRPDDIRLVFGFDS